MLTPIPRITNKATCLPLSSSSSSSTTPSRKTLLSRDSLHLISQFLQPNEIGRSIQVCKVWENALNDNLIWNWQAERVKANVPPQLQAALGSYKSARVDGQFDPRILRIISGYQGKIENAKQQFSNPTPAIAFGRQEWIDHVGDPGPVPSLPSNIHTILQEPCKFWPGKTVEETHKLVLIPKTITRFIKSKNSFVTVPVTLKMLGAFITSSHDGAGVGFEYINAAILEEHGDTPVEEAHWVLMTNDVVPGSRGICYVDQKQLVELKGYKIPNVLDASPVVLLENIRSGKRLLSDDPLTYTRCQETIRSYQVVVGGFGPGGLYVSFPDFDSAHIGVVALRKFLGH